MRRLLLAALLLSLSGPLGAEPPTRPIGTFATAKAIARDRIYLDHRKTLYCGCDFTPSQTRSGGVIDATACGYEARSNEARGKRLEWEHIMPASTFGHLRACWKDGHPECIKSSGETFKGRKCCTKAGIDPEFRRMEADLHNLAPSVGELNGDRLNHPFGVVKDEPRDYGACDFEVGGSPKVAEPTEAVRGNVARVWLYMSDAYNIRLSPTERQRFEAWSEADSVDQRELLRDSRIEAEQGNRNPFVRP